MILFKNKIAELDYQVAPKALREICDTFEMFSLFFNIVPVITRVRESVECDSGVHEAGRGVDFRDQHVQTDLKIHYLYTPEQVDAITRGMNDKYPRSDGKPTCLHHSFKGGPAHFHIQLEADKLLPGEPLARLSLPSDPASSAKA